MNYIRLSCCDDWEESIDRVSRSDPFLAIDIPVFSQKRHNDMNDLSQTGHAQNLISWFHYLIWCTLNLPSGAHAGNTSKCGTRVSFY